jgi:isoaspartyl peptidase/L-asparaginase-like protein (Ntn-hydrolase superfamily)
MIDRRKFIKNSSLAIGSALIASNAYQLEGCADRNTSENDAPLVISTWKHGLEANATAWDILKKGGRSLDAVEQGVSVIEADMSNRSVGLGGRPDRDGYVTLDACIMDERSRCGSVAFLQNIDHPIQVARQVMEKTNHVMLVGAGAYKFALEMGFKPTKNEVPLPKVRDQWQEWLQEEQYQPIINIENHDTIGMLALDSSGNLSGSCTTSGMGYKLHGRVGDSPIIGAGLFVDNEVGAATATGVGEAVIRIAGSHTVVELMRSGANPEEACYEAVMRIIKKHDNIINLQVGFIAIDKNGVHGGYSVYDGFDYAIRNKERNEMIMTKSYTEWQ